MLQVLLDRNSPADPLPEIQTLCREAEWRGELFDIFQSPSTPASLHIRFSLCTKEISVQGVKQTPPIHNEQKNVGNAANISDAHLNSFDCRSHYFAHGT